jgi:hypothetical protein
MPRSRPRTCKVCGWEAIERREVSYNGLCGPCGEAREVGNAMALVAREGPEYEAWKRRCIQALNSLH